MTREEAIDYLVDPIGKREKHDEAIDMAIEALSQESSEDVISRQAAIDAINKAFERVFAWGGTDPLGDKVLENVPSAERKHGEWRYGENDIGLDGYWCTVCGEFVLWDYKGTIDFIHRYNYCPNCGSYMRGDEDER